MQFIFWLNINEHFAVIIGRSNKEIFISARFQSIAIFMKIFLETDSRQIHIQTQIWLINTILTFATKHLMITNKDNLYLHLKTF